MLKQSLWCFLLLICFHRSLACPINCANCDSFLNSCFECNPGFYLDSSETCTPCPNNCVSCFSADSCIQCQTNMYWNSSAQVCATCDPNCLMCESFGSIGCSQCKVGYALDFQSGSCGACGSSCLSCLETDICSACPNGQVFTSNGDGTVQCAVSCPANSSNCTACSQTQGFTLVDNAFSCGTSGNVTGNNAFIVSGGASSSP